MIDDKLEEQRRYFWQAIFNQSYIQVGSSAAAIEEANKALEAFDKQFKPECKVPQINER